MKKYVCLRDDDTCYHTSIGELENAYGELWGTLPITLAVVPFIHGSLEIMNQIEEPKYDNLREWQINATPEELTRFHKIYPIGDNIPLVSALRPLINKGTIEIAQHGVNHRYNERGPEMLSDEMGYRAIRDGKEYLERLFNTKVLFIVPPSNTIDVKCLSYIKRVGLNLYSSGRIVRNNSDKPAISVNRILRGISKRIIGKYASPIISWRGVSQISAHTYVHFMKYEDILYVLKDDLNRYGFTSIGTHYTSFSESGYKENFHRIISELRDIEGVEFLTVSKYFDLLKAKYK